MAGGMRSPALTPPHGQPAVVRLETRPGPATSCLVIAKLVVLIGYGFFLAEALNSGEAGEMGPAIQVIGMCLHRLIGSHGPPPFSGG